MGKIRVTSSVPPFRCIGGACIDSCCVGWDVDIDKETYRKYRKVADPTLKPLFNRNLKVRQSPFRDDIDYASVDLNSDRECAFLDCDRLCMIQRALGESSLSNVCASFPRITNLIDGKLETSLSMACPEAAKLSLSKGNSFEIVDVKPVDDTSMRSRFITYEVDTRAEEYSDDLPRYLKELRSLSMDIVGAGIMTLPERLATLGFVLQRVSDAYDNAGIGSVELVLSRQMKMMDDGTLFGSYAPMLEMYGGTEDLEGFLAMLTEALGTEDEIDSERYRGYMRMAAEGRRLGMDRQALEGFDDMMAKYLQTFIFREIFPFSDADSIMESFILMACRYLMASSQMEGISRYLASRGLPLEEDMMIDFIQAFSKTIEHHKTFIGDVYESISEGSEFRAELAAGVLL